VRNYERVEEVGLAQESIERRAKNRDGGADVLAKAGIQFESKNAGAHLIVRHAGKAFDFWPGTGKFIPREPKPKHGRGVFNLLKILGVN